MQPLNWDTAARTPAADSVSLYAGPDASRSLGAESFGSHLHRFDPALPPVISRENESSRPDSPADRQPLPSARPVPPGNPAAPPEQRAAQPAEDAAAAQDTTQQIDSAAQPAETQLAETQPAETQPAETQLVEAQEAETQPAETQPAETQPAETQLVEAQDAEAQDAETQPTGTQDELAQAAFADLPALNDESDGQSVRVVKRDSKSPASSRVKSASRQSAVAANREVDSRQSTTDTETPPATERQVTTPSSKLRVVVKSKPDGPPQELSAQPDSVVPSVTTDLAGEGDVTRQTRLTLDVEAASQSSTAAGIDDSQTAVEQLATQKAAETQSGQRSVELIAADPSGRVPRSDVDRSAQIGRRGRRAAREDGVADAIAPSGNSLPSERTLELPASLEQFQAKSAHDELPTAPVAIESATVPAPATSVSNGSAPIPPHLRFIQHLAAKPGERSAKSSPLTDLERARLVDRVARAFQAAEGRGGTVTLRLHPPELGALKVELSVIEGALSARLEAETPAARIALLDNVQLLQDRLAEQGVRIERFDVDLLDRRSAEDAPTFEHNRPRDQDPRHQPPPDASSLERHEPDSIRPSPRPIATGQLNVVV